MKAMWILLLTLAAMAQAAQAQDMFYDKCAATLNAVGYNSELDPYTTSFKQTLLR
ncbi:MAG: hypothetical protein KF799_06300 [Bdellovibrionales bacterium]|nr:hypothetical protein [Bdellovibrionales bacterium]